MDQLKYIDIFAGCGGASLGLHNAGYGGIFAVEKNPMAFETLKHNLVDKVGGFDWPAWLPKTSHDIMNVLKKYDDKLEELNGKIDLVVGGPPCQGFSTAGRRNPSDHRNQMVNYYAKFIRLTMPHMLFFENVPGFQMRFSGEVRYSDVLISKLKKMGYKPYPRIINFSDFCVPQSRRRFLLVGVLDGDPESVFEKMCKNKKAFAEKKNIEENPTTGDAISDLERKNGEVMSPDSPNFTNGIYSKPVSRYQKTMRKKTVKEVPDSHRFARHSDHKVAIFLKILKQGGNSRHCVIISHIGGTKKRDTTVLSANSPSPALTTLPDDYLHYSEPRILSVREYARIQGFDDSFEFRGKYTTGGRFRTLEVPRYTQAGNALSPLIVEQAANILKHF